MDKKQGASVVVLVLLSFYSITVVANANANANVDDDDDNGDQSKKSAMWVWQRLRSAYSMYSSIFPTTIGQYWHMAKTIVNHTYAYFFPPNIDFRRSGDEGELAVANNKNGAAGEKVKEALAKSIGTSKATIEDAAKSAAEKVKRTLSDDHKEQNKRPKEL